MSEIQDQFEKDYLASTAEPHQHHPTIFRLPAVVLHYAFWKKFQKDSPVFAISLCKYIVQRIDEIYSNTVGEISYKSGYQQCLREQQTFQNVTNLDEILKYVEADFFAPESTLGTYEIKFYPADTRTPEEVVNDVKSSETEYTLDICLRIENHREFFTVSIFFFSKKASIHKSAIASQHILNELLGKFVSQKDFGLSALKGENLNPSNKFMKLTFSEHQDAAKKLQTEILERFVPEFENALFEEGHKHLPSRNDIRSYLMGRFVGTIINSKIFCTHPTWRDFVQKSTPDWTNRHLEGDQSELPDSQELKKTKRAYVVPQSGDFTFPDRDIDVLKENASRFIEEITGSIDAAKAEFLAKAAFDRSQLPEKIYDPRFRNTIACLMSWGDAIYISSLGGQKADENGNAVFSKHQKPVYFTLIYLSERRWPISRLTRRLLYSGTNRFAALRRIDALRRAAKRVGELERLYAEFEANRYSSSFKSKVFLHSLKLWFPRPRTVTGWVLAPISYPVKLVLLPFKRVIDRFVIPVELKEIYNGIDRMQQGYVGKNSKLPDLEEGLLYRLNRSKHYQDHFKRLLPKLGVIPIPTWQPYDSFMEGRVFSTFEYVNKIHERTRSLREVLASKGEERNNTLLVLLTIIATVAAIIGLLDLGGLIGKPNLPEVHNQGNCEQCEMQQHFSVAPLTTAPPD